MTYYVNPYTGSTINPSQVGYESLTISQSTTLQWPINGNNANIVANIIEVTATAPNLNLILPPATQVSPGQAFIIRNLGTNAQYSFTVTDNSGNTIQTVPVSPTSTTTNTYYIYLTNNLTVNGIWSSISLGIGTSSASASALAGLGLKAINTTLNTNTVVSLVSSAYTFTSNDRAALYVWTGGAGTITLPTVGSVNAGWYTIVKNDGAGILTVSAQGSSYIDNVSTQTSVQIQIANSSVFVTDGTNWFTYALAQQNVFNYTQLLLSLTGNTNATVTLTAAQAKNVIQTYSGILTQNTTIILPQTVQLYSLNNLTTGSFTLTFSTGVSGKTTVVLPQNQAALVICDGSNVYNANSATLSFASTLTLGNGSAAAPSLNFQSDNTTGLYLAASGQLGFAIAGTSAGTLTAAGLLLPVGISGGTF
jgi:hypothetical protein